MEPTDPLHSSTAVDALHTAEDVALARLHLMEWRAAIDEQFPGDVVFDLVGRRIAAAITARAVALGLETL